MTYPTGTVVLLTPTDGTRQVVYIRNHPSVDCQWRGTDGSHVRDSQISNWAVVHGIRELLSPTTMPIDTADLTFSLAELTPLGSGYRDEEGYKAQVTAEGRIRAIRDAIRAHHDIDWEVD